ncbi:LysR substrate-binding domain-containing protein [Ruegeria lacuscaerulensis]|uniref:LysR substrate-binding domain-containing protein n=1 Tax=Ruegeria lacuscaerulensis TaxID=55218 RepID=UPI00147E0078
MRYSQLRAFHHVALHGGFSRAAEALFLTQPAVSEQVRRLEQDHDLLLFQRDRKQVVLTAAGERLFRFTKQYFETEAQIEDFLSESRAAIDGELRIIADSAHHLTDYLGQFRAAYPNITITVRSGNTNDVLDELRAYNAEIGIVGSPSPGKDMTLLDLGSARIVGFAARERVSDDLLSLSMSELQNHPLVFREKGSKTRQKLEDEARRAGITLNPAIVAEGREAVRELVASGAGIGFVSQAEFGRDDRIRQIPLEGVDLQMGESMIHLTQRADVRVIRAFMEFVARIRNETSV